MEQILTTTIGKQNGIDIMNAYMQWHYGSVEPNPTYPFQNWGDTGNNLWKQRNESDDGWIVRGILDSPNFGLAFSTSIIPLDGWVTGLTAVYASATSMTIAGIDVTDRIQQGTKIRYKQGSGYKYDFVSSVAFSTDTTLTLMGGSTVEEEAITEFWFSNIATPIGWPFGVDYIEGSNENGNWKKWVDGALECWGSITFTSLSVTSVGSIYYNNTPSLVFAVEFYVEPIANIWVELSVRTTWAASGSTTTILTTGINNIYIARATDGTIDNLTLGYHAKGRWKE